MNWKQLGYTENENTDDLTPLARVSAVRKERYALLTPEGERYAKLKSSVYFGADAPPAFPTTGDFVACRWNDSGDSLIVDTLPRRSYFARLNPTTRQQEQAVAANFDYVLVLSSLNQDFSAARLERYLTLAWQSGATPVVVLTKADLMGDHEAMLHEAQRVALGCDVVMISSREGTGLEALQKYTLPGKTLVLLGSSGVGKSTLINALAGRELLKTSAIRKDDDEGRHTTTHRQLVVLDSGAIFIDTPGMRELGMWDVSVGLGDAFGEIETLAQQCRFADCRHEREPGCAVCRALETGELDAARWESYQKLMKEARFTKNTAEYIREKQTRNRGIAMFGKEMKKAGMIRK